MPAPGYNPNGFAPTIASMSSRNYNPNGFAPTTATMSSRNYNPNGFAPTTATMSSHSMASPSDLFNAFAPGVSSMIGGLTANSGGPYEDARKIYNEYLDKAVAPQNPFHEAGLTALPQYQQWASGMQDPTNFINGLMNNYQESPFAKYQQRQGIRAAQNLGSATGLTGSTPLMQQAQQNAQNISSQDMMGWLQNVLGVNNQYGGALNNLIGGGQHAADMLSSLYGNAAQFNAGQLYNQKAAENNDDSSFLGGLVDTVGGFFGL